MTDRATDAEQTPPEEPKTSPVTSGEVEVAMAGPAFIVNRMVASNAVGGMRISFMEQYGAGLPLYFRCAVFCSFTEAKSLRDLIDRQLQRAAERDLVKPE